MDAETKYAIVAIGTLGLYELWEWKKEDIPEIIKKIVYWVCYLAAVYILGIVVSVSPLSIWLLFMILLLMWVVSCSVIFGTGIGMAAAMKDSKDFWKKYYQSDGLWLMSLMVILFFLVGYK